MKTSSLLATPPFNMGSINGFCDEILNVKGEILEFGTYKVLAHKEDVPNPTESNKSESPVHIVSVVEFVEHTNQIIARKGISFGFRYKLTGLTNMPAVLDFETIYPEFTFPDGHKDSGRTIRGECEPELGVWESTMGYHFDEGFEMVDGDWVMSIYYNKKKLVTRTFHVKNVAP